MPITLNGTTGITTPTYNGSTTAEYLVPVTGFKNKLINGNFNVWQYATSASITTASSYNTADRWRLQAGGTVTFAQDASDFPTGSRYSLSCTTTASSSFAQIRQYLEAENVIGMRGQVVTVSCYVKTTGTAYSGVQRFECAFNTTSDLSNVGTFVALTATAGSTDFTPTGTWTQYSVSVTVPSNAVGFYVGIIPTVVQASGNVMKYAQFQCELGTNVTSFDYRPFGTELNLCQRYYQTSYPYGTAIQAATGVTDGVTFISINTSDSCNGGVLPVTMRATPTFAVYSTLGGVGSASVRDNSTGASITGITLNGGTTTNLPRLSKVSGLPATGVSCSAQYTAQAEL